MTDSINEAARAMGKRGGASKSIAKRQASAANLAIARAARRAHKPQPVTITLNRKATLTEAELREICEKYAPSNSPKPQPTAVPDEMAQEENSDDFTS